MAEIDITDSIHPKVVSVMNLSLAFAVITMLLLSNLLGGVHAINNFDNVGQKKLEFRDTINLTNNDKDSVYGQVSTSDENVYVVWQESIPGSDPRNYDILFKRREPLLQGLVVELRI
jgi:hypothetical protein